MVTRMRTERGAVLVFVALAMIVIIALIGIGIDGYRSFSSHTEKQFGADYAAMSALSAYLGMPTGAAHTARVAAAVTRAEEISGQNRVSGLNDLPNFQTGDTFHIGPGTAADSQVGAIHFGRWWTEAPATCVVGGCPCTGTVPCFQECNTTSGCDDPEVAGGVLLADALSMSLQTKDTEQLKTTFASAMGFTNLNVRAGGIAVGLSGSSTVAVVPRHVVFAIDLSRFTTMDATSPLDTYTPVERGSTDAKEYAYRLSTSTCPGGPPYSVASPYDAQWNSQVSAAEQADYQCVNVTRNGTAEAYLVANLADDPARTPKPHSSMLNALSTALQNFEDQASGPGRLNRVAVIGFDNEIHRERRWGFDAGVNQSTLVRYDDAEIVALQNALLSRNGRLSASLFPRTGRGSDTSFALRQAREILRRHPRFTSAENSVVLLTNGLATCERTSGVQQCVTLNNPPLYSEYVKHYDALTEVYTNVVQGLYRDDKIKLHTLYFGRDTTPHTLLIKSASGGCMSDYEMRNRGYMNVTSDTTANDALRFAALGTGSFVSAGYSRPAMYFYGAVGVLQGKWGPIRPPCDPTGTVNWTSNFNSRCSSEATPPMSSPPSSMSVPTSSGTYAIYEPTYGSSRLDTLKRVVCDPSFPVRTELDQVQAFMKDVLEEPSFLLVE